MSIRSFKVGDRVRISPPSSFNDRIKWNGVTGTIKAPSAGVGYITILLDIPPEGWHLLEVSVSTNDAHDYLKHLESLSPLEEQIAAYVKAEMAALS